MAEAEGRSEKPSAPGLESAPLLRWERTDLTPSQRESLNWCDRDC